MAVPVISNLPPAPTRSDGPADFTPKADAMIGALQPMVVQINIATQWMAGQLTEAQAQAAAAAASALAAANSATAANASKNAAAQSAIDATNNGAAQVELAAAQVGLAVIAKNTAEVAAPAAQAAAGLPSLAGNAYKVLRVKTTEDGVEWGLGLPSVAGVAVGKALIVGPGNTVAWAEQGKIGDILISAVNPGSLWLPADGSIRAQSSYPVLFAAVGLIGTSPGVVWGSVATGTASNTVFTAASESGTVIVLATDGSVSRSTDRGATFTNQPTTRGGTTAIATDGAGTWIITTSLIAGTAYRSTDDGLTWNSITMLTTSSGGWNKIVYAGNNTWLAIATSTANSQIARSTNGGTSWANVAHSLGPITLQEIGADKSTGTCLIAGGTSIRRSTDYGATWASAPNTAANIQSMANNGAGLWMMSGTTPASNTYISNNNGASFSLVTNSLPNATVTYMTYANNTFFLTNSAGTFYSYLDLVFTPIGTGGTIRSVSRAGSGVLVGATNSTNVSRSIPYSYDPGTQFQVPRQPTGVGLTAYIKALEAA